MRVQELFDLSGRRALVTGGGRGLGRHLALGLAEAGAEVWVASRKLSNCEETVAEVEARGGTARAVQADLEDPAEIEQLVDTVLADGGRLHILVNNAGMVWASPSLEYPIEGWDRVFGLNVRALWLLTQRVARHMAEQGGGSIIHIGSISAWRCASDDQEPVVAYNASKGAVLTLTRDLAVKLAPQGIRVNCIAPGAFLTDMMNHVRHDEKKLAAFDARIPAGRSGVEDDMKGAVVFLASDAAAYVSGHTLVVDGGWSCT